MGRIVAYAAVGLVENAVPAYNAELSPAATRGLLSGSLLMVTGLGNLWGAGMSRAYATETAAKGWMIPTGVQLIPAILLLTLAPWCPESPRWLIIKGRKADAKAALDRIRPAADVQSGATQAEADALELVIEESDARDQGSWLDLFRGNYLRRTWVSGGILCPIAHFVSAPSPLKSLVSSLMESPHLLHIKAKTPLLIRTVPRYRPRFSSWSRPMATSSFSRMRPPFTCNRVSAPRASPTVLWARGWA